MRYSNKQDLIKSKEVLHWWKNSGESTKKGKSDYRTPINVEEPEVEREEPDRGEIYRLLQKIIDFYYKIVAGVAPRLRKQFAHDEDKYDYLIRTLQDHVANKIKQEPESKKAYIQIGKLVRFYGDVDTYNEFFKGTQRQMNKVLKAIANELNQVAIGDPPEEKGNTLLFGMNEAEQLEILKQMLKSASLEELKSEAKLIQYINSELVKLKYSRSARYQFLEWVVGGHAPLLEDLPTGTDMAYKTKYVNRPSSGSFPYTADQFALDWHPDERERVKYAFDGASTDGLNLLEDDIDQLVKIHNDKAEVTEDEKVWLDQIKELVHREPIVIGSKALGTALEDGSSDLDIFIAVPDEQAFKEISIVLQGVMSSSKFNDTEQRHSQNRVFNSEDRTKQVGIGYGPNAEAFVESVIGASLRVTEEQRDKIRQAKEDTKAVGDAAKKSYDSLKTALDTLLGIERMIAPADKESKEINIVEFNTGSYGGQITSSGGTLPPEQRGKRKVHWDNEPGINSPAGVDQPAREKSDKSDAIDAHDIHSRPAAQNTQAKMTGDGARRNNGTGFVNNYIQRAGSQEEKQKIAGRAMNFSDTDDMEFKDLDKKNISDNKKDVEETVEFDEKTGINKEVLSVIEKMLSNINLTNINEFYKVEPQLQFTNDDYIKAHYNFDNNIIYVNPHNVTDKKDFLLSYLHEIKHVLKNKETDNLNEFKSAYEQKIAEFQAKNPGKEDEWYHHHPDEHEAEVFAQQEIKKWTGEQ
tara:strand:+ start:621 stop:2870 length:2250 start_codon:yes stop_codon:yes gene_type:complete